MQMTYMIYKVPLREVPRGVAQGHIIITTGRNGHLLLYNQKNLPLKILNSHFTRNTCSWVYSIAVFFALFGY